MKVVISCIISNFKSRAHLLVCLCCYFILLHFSSSFAQSNSEFYKIKYFTLENGLSQVTINNLLLDKSGFVWIATQDGLNRFDGNEFKQFKYIESDSTTISGNHTNKLLEDKKGNIWVGTIGNGLNYYNPDKAVFYRIELENSSSENEIISALAEDNNGAIWVASRESGLHKLEYNEDNTFKQTQYFKDQPLNSLLYDDRGNLWIGDFEGNIYKFDNKNQEHVSNRIETRVKGNVQALYNTGTHLLIGSDYGFFMYDLNNKKTDIIELETSGIFKTKHVLAFLQKDLETVWIATGNGLYLFNWKQKKVVKKIQNKGNSNKGLSNNTVQAIIKLSKEELLVGTANYLNLINFISPDFNNISKNKRGYHLLNDNVVFSILKNDTDLWIGTSDGGLNLLRGDNVYFINEDENNPTSISGAVVRAIVKDDKNKRMWLATTRGLSMLDLTDFNPNNPKFKVFHYNAKDLNSISGDFLKDIVIDKNNNLWGATRDRGIFRLEMDENNNVKIFRYRNESDNQNSLKNDFTNCIRVDTDNNLWIGSEGGLTKLSFTNATYNNPKFDNYFRNSNSTKPISHNSIYDILIDEKERIWIATRHGLNLFLGNNEFESWTEQDQFPNAVVYSIQNDDDGNLWLGTNNGLVRYNPENNFFSHYGVEDGIQSKEFDTHAKFKDDTGTIYMGGIGGVTYFQPNELKSLDSPKPLYFSQLKVKDEIIRPTNSNNILANALKKTKELVFKQDQFPFYLKFSAIDFRLQKNITYGYKLLPNDSDWNMLEDTEIQFLNLPSGDYNLLVNGFSRGIEWRQPPLEMNLTVLPPIWSTWWAYTLYVLILLYAAFTFYNFQLSKKMAIAERNQLKELGKLKNDLYTNITHEFRTPITVILGMADTLKTNFKKNKFDDAEKSLDMIHRNGESLLLLVNEMLDLAKSESGNMGLQLVQADIVPFLKYLCESFNSLAREKQINLTIYSEIETLIMDFDANKIASIISNLLTNAIKFTPEYGKIIVHVNRKIKKNKSYLFIKIMDNGIGISKADVPNIFNRFYQTEASFSNKKEGTGIGLALTKELVELMNGTITVKSKLAKGSEFILLFPVKRNAPTAKEIETNSVTHTFVPKTLPKEAEEPIETNSESPLVLIIEDNIDVAQYLKACLKDKYKTVYAKNGVIGIDMAFDKVPDIIICDVMMPVMNGLEVCATLKSDERTDHIPIIILTAKVTAADRLAGLSHGADAYLSKPFNKEELFTRLDQLVLLRKKLIGKIKKEGSDLYLDKETKNPKIQFLQKVAELIHEEIGNSKFGTESLASKLQLSDSQVYRKIKAITGKSTAIFVRSIRLQYANELLKNTDKTISEVAYESGFNSPSWFSRAFKEEFGVAPSSTSK